MAIELPKASQPSVQEEKSPSLASFLNSGPKRVSGSDLMFFTERLALLLETGNSLCPSLMELHNQTDNAAMAAILKAMATDVESGKSFSDALGKHPEMFSSTYVNLVRASEHGGFMYKVLMELKDMEEKKDNLRSTIQSALAYPAFLLFFSVAVVVFILIVVFPKFDVLFKSIRDQLPFTTLMLMSASDLMRHYWYIIFALLAAGGVALRKWMLSEQGGGFLDRMKLEAPVVNDVFVKLYLVQLLRIMSLSIGNGVSVVDALRSSSEVVNNRLFRDYMLGIEQHVSDGKGLAAGFEKMPFLPSMARQMIRTGENTGNISLVMGRLADFYEKEVGKKLTTFSKSIEPVMLLVMGVLVGLIVASLILPIFKLSRAVN